MIGARGWPLFVLVAAIGCGEGAVDGEAAVTAGASEAGAGEATGAAGDPDARVDAGDATPGGGEFDPAHAPDGPDRPLDAGTAPAASPPDAAIAPDAAAAPDAAPASDAAPADPHGSEEAPTDDAPELPVCDCFVRVGWCGEGAAAEGLRRDPPCRVPIAEAHADDLLACDGDTWIVREDCAFGCFAQPTGTPDHCNPDPDAAPTPESPGWPACPEAPLLHRGLHPEASDRLRCAGVTSARITQTVGNAAASAGYHAADGQVNGLDYTAAVDLRTRDMRNGEIRDLLDRLALHGFAAWYRQPGADGWPAGEAPHIHAIFVGVRMKRQLRGQVRDFLRGRNGLSSHRAYGFWQPDAERLRIIRLLFSRHYDP